MGLTLRSATKKDSDLLYAWRRYAERESSWWKGTPATPRTHARWLIDRLRSPAVRVWVAELDGEPVGQARLDSNGELSVQIVSKYQGKGYGVQLIVAVCALAQDYGHSRVKANVDSTNFAARSAFLKAGFVERDDVRFYLWKP